MIRGRSGGAVVWMRVTSIADAYALAIARRVKDAGRVDRYQRYVRKLGVGTVITLYRGVQREPAGTQATRLSSRCEEAFGGEEEHA